MSEPETTKNGYLVEHGTQNPRAPMTKTTLVDDVEREQALSASLFNMVERFVLGFQPFTTTEPHIVGSKCFYDRKLWKFTDTLAQGAAWDSTKVNIYTMVDLVNDMKVEITSMLEEGLITPLTATTLSSWLNQKALVKENTTTTKIRTSGAKIPIETDEGSKPVSIKPISDYFVKCLYNSSYNQLKSAEVGDDKSNPLIGGTLVGGAYFLIPKLTLGTFGTAVENNGMLFTQRNVNTDNTGKGDNIHPVVYFKPLGDTEPQSLTDGIEVIPTIINYDSKTYYSYETSGMGWFILTYPTGKTIEDICAHIAWEDWYDKFVGVDEEDDPADPDYNPEAAFGLLILEEFAKLIHSDGVWLFIDDETKDWLEFDNTGINGHHVVDFKTTTDNDWMTSEIEEGIYLHSHNVGNNMKRDGKAILKDNTKLTVEGTTVSFSDQDATVSGQKLLIKYERAAEEIITRAYTDSVFAGSNINTSNGKMNINDCGIEANMGAIGTAFTTTRYAINIIDALAQIAQVQLSDSLQVIAEAIAELWYNIKGLNENLQNYSYKLKVQSIDMVELPMVCNQPLVVSGSGAPSVVPMFIGQHYHDTTNNKCYEAFYVTGSTSDWKILN